MNYNYSQSSVVLMMTEIKKNANNSNNKPKQLQYRLPPDIGISGAQQQANQFCLIMDAIYDQRVCELSFEDSYRIPYNLVTQKYGDLLYEAIILKIRDHLSHSLIELSLTENDIILEMMVHASELHSNAFKLIGDVGMYMNKCFLEVRKRPLIQVVGMQLFRDVLIYDARLGERIRRAILEKIGLERIGLIIPRDLMKSILHMYEELSSAGVDVYEQEFEVFFLEATRDFYTIESLDYLSKYSCHDFLITAESRMVEEMARVSHYLAKRTEPKLMKVVQKEWVINHAKTILEMESNGFMDMLENNKLDDLQRIYKLFGLNSHCLDMLREALGKFIVQKGKDIVQSHQNAKDPIEFVQTILNLNEKFDTMIKQTFRSDKKALKILKESFEVFLNQDHQSASHLASFTDHILKNRTQFTNEYEIDSNLERVMIIFKYLTDKDVFENFYKIFLSKRLLAGKAASDDAEKSMIAKMKSECGYQFTSKLEGMFVDMNISKTIMDEYRQMGAMKSYPIELDIIMLTTGYWPIQQPGVMCHLPVVMEQCCDMFSDYYHRTNSGRKLTWLPNYGSVDMKATFPKCGRIDLNVSVYQAAILYLFNDTDVLTLDKIRQACAFIPEVELRRHLLSLCTSKIKIFKKSSKGKGIEDDDSFSFNDEFTSKLKRIKVPLIASNEIFLSSEYDSNGSAVFDTTSSSGNLSALPSTVEEDRRHLVEAAIVRIMKSRKTISHNDLIGEVTKQMSSRFIPSPQFIKKRIESLIEREYMERDALHMKCYTYLA